MSTACSIVISSSVLLFETALLLNPTHLFLLLFPPILYPLSLPSLFSLLSFLLSTVQNVLPNYRHCRDRLHLLSSQISESNRHPKDQESPRDPRSSSFRKFTPIWNQSCQSGKRLGKEIWTSLPSTTGKSSMLCYAIPSRQSIMRCALSLTGTSELSLQTLSIQSVTFGSPINPP